MTFILFQWETIVKNPSSWNWFIWVYPFLKFECIQEVQSCQHIIGLISNIHMYVYIYLIHFQDLSLEFQYYSLYRDNKMTCTSALNVNVMTFVPNSITENFVLSAQSKGNFTTVYFQYSVFAQRFAFSRNTYLLSIKDLRYREKLHKIHFSCIVLFLHL